MGSVGPVLSQSPLLTPRDAAARLSVSEKTLHRLSAPTGTIPVVRIGKRGVRYTTAALDRWIADQEAASLDILEAIADGNGISLAIRA